MQRMSEFLSSRRGKMFGIAEVVALAGSCFVLALVLLSYLYFLVPARSRRRFFECRSASRCKPTCRRSASVVNKDTDTKQNCRHASPRV